jgi:hypothetical protein
VTFLTNKETPKVFVDPQFGIEWRDIVDFLGEFGPFNGRYVPRYPNDWTARLKEHLEDLTLSAYGPVKRQAILERIRRELPLCSVPVSWEYAKETSWSANISQAITNHQDSIVVGNALEPAPFKAWADALEDIQESRRRTWRFHGTVSEYVEACRPLILNSPASYLIDCYLDPFSDVAENLLRSLFTVASGSKCYSIELITRKSICGEKSGLRNTRDMSETEIEVNFKRMYRGLIPKDRRLTLHLVTEGKLGGDALRLHDRFFLTTHGSINFGQGYLLLNQPLPQQNAFVVDKEHHQQFKRTYIDGVARHAERLPKVSSIPYPLKVVSICA